MSVRKDVENYLKQLRDQGYEVKWCQGSQHWMVKWRGRAVYTIGGTPGRHSHSLVNMKAYIRRFERQRQQDSGRRAAVYPAGSRSPAK